MKLNKYTSQLLLGAGVIAAMVAAVSFLYNEKETTVTSTEWGKSWCDDKGGRFEEWKTIGNRCHIPIKDGVFVTGQREVRFVFKIKDSLTGQVDAFIADPGIWDLNRIGLVEYEPEYAGTFKHPGGDFEK